MFDRRRWFPQRCNRYHGAKNHKLWNDAQSYGTGAIVISKWLDAEVQLPLQTVRVLFAVALLGARGADAHAGLL